ncbi:MAG: NAD(P)-dependent oxidoreductase [Gemmatimonadota bacterium]
MKISFLGLGAIGTPMAAHLARAHELTVWNRTTERARVFSEQHSARLAETPRDAAGGAEIVITCLPTSREVESVLEGPDGMETALARGTLLVDCTSGDPASSRRIAARLDTRGVGFIDAPVSGGTDGAVAAALTVMVGGEAPDVERAMPILALFGKRIEHLGPVGAGHATKAINNALLAVNIAAVGEGAAALARAGVNLEKAFAVLNASSGRSFVSEKLVPERVLTGLWPRTFRLALLEKDVGIACAMLDELNVDGPLIELARELFRQARLELGESADYLEIIKLIEQQAGVELRT